MLAFTEHCGLHCHSKSRLRETFSVVGKRLPSLTASRSGSASGTESARVRPSFRSDGNPSSCTQASAVLPCFMLPLSMNCKSKLQEGRNSNRQLFGVLFYIIFHMLYAIWCCALFIGGSGSEPLKGFGPGIWGFGKETAVKIASTFAWRLGISWGPFHFRA